MTDSTGPKKNAETSRHTTDRDEARAIEKWARRYAQHRTLPVLVAHLYSRYALRKLKKLSRMDAPHEARDTEAG